MRSRDLKDDLRENGRISEADLNQIIEMTQYGSMGSLQLIIELLKTVLNRIELDGDEIIDGRTEEVFTSESFRKFISDNFSEYLTDELYSELETERKEMNK